MVPDRYHHGCFSERRKEEDFLFLFRRKEIKKSNLNIFSYGLRLRREKIDFMLVMLKQKDYLTMI